MPTQRPWRLVLAQRGHVLRRRSPTGTVVCSASSLRALLFAAPLAHGHYFLRGRLPTGTACLGAAAPLAYGHCLLRAAMGGNADNGLGGKFAPKRPTPAQVPVPATLAADPTRAARRHQHRRRLTPGRRTPTPTGASRSTTTVISSVTRASANTAAGARRARPR